MDQSQKKKKKKATRPTLFENFMLLQYNNFFFLALRHCWNKNILYMDSHWRIFGEDSFWRNSDLHFSNTCYLAHQYSLGTFIVANE